MFLLNLSKLAELRAAALFDIKDEVNKTHPMTCTYLADAEADIRLGSSLAHGGGLNSRLTARQIAASSLLMELGKYHRLLFAFDDSILRTHDSKSEEYLKYFNAFETREFTLIESLNNYLTYIEESLSRPFALNLIKDNATPIDPYDMDITHPMAQADNAKAEVIKSEPKRVIQRVFADLHFDYKQWGRNLGDVPQWLEPCRVSRGSKGKRVSHTWDPVLIGLALMDKGITKKQLNLVFMDLKDWKSKWQEKTDLMD